MKAKFNLFLVVSFFSLIAYAQQNTSSVNPGDRYRIGIAVNDNYNHIHFPKNNLIIKKGGVVDYEKVKNALVEVVSTKTDDNGNTIATIALVSKGRFFNSHKYVTVELEGALKNKEIVKV